MQARLRAPCPRVEVPIDDSTWAKGTHHRAYPTSHARLCPPYASQISDVGRKDQFAPPASGASSDTGACRREPMPAMLIRRVKSQ
jgi:hypothetical protein